MLLLLPAAAPGRDRLPAWLSVQGERDVATTAATMSNILGQMVASVLPAVIVQNVTELPNVMLYQARLSVRLSVRCGCRLADPPARSPPPLA